MILVNGLELKYNSGKEIPLFELLKFSSLVESINKFEIEYKKRLPSLKWYQIPSHMYNGRKEGKYYITKLIDLLAVTKRPQRHIKKIPAIIKALEFRNDTENIKNPRKNILNISTWLAVKLKQTPDNILKGVASENIEDLIYEIRKEELRDLINKFKVKHDAVSYKNPKAKTPLQKEIEKGLKELEKLKNKVIDYIKPEKKIFRPFKPIKAHVWK